MVLRVNVARTSRAAMLEALQAQGVGAAAGMVPTAIVLDEPMDVAALPGFAEGLVSVQDAGAQHAAPLLDARAGERVLDACAAPGGKTGHILEHTPDLASLIALDMDEARLTRVRANLDRLGLQAQLQCADLLAADWWDGTPFDRILLDAPCSGTGVIRRHPDIRLLRRAEDIEGFARQQLALLDRCAELLAPVGRIVYATCSILPAEGAQVVERFLHRHPGFARAGDDVQLLPAPRASGPAAQTDGFYYACLARGGPGA
jgi:16S rRNA (cytosine967-C5)-methyltransferase